MLKKITISLCSLVLMIPAVYASDHYPQHINLCMEINQKNVNYQFKTAFISHDFGDNLSESENISNGKTCIGKTYKSGPKNMQLYVFSGAGGMLTKPTLSIIANSSCYYMEQDGSGRLMSQTLRTGRANENWVFTLTQRSTPNQFDMSCKHWAT